MFQASLLLMLPGAGKLDKDLSTVNESQECAKCHTLSLTFKVCKANFAPFFWSACWLYRIYLSQVFILGLLSMCSKECVEPY